MSSQPGLVRALMLGGFCFWAGATLLLSRSRWFSRRSLVERLRPYEPGGLTLGAGTHGTLSVGTFADVIGPLARSAGERLTRLVGVSEELPTRLRRVHSPMDATDFRVRQLGWSAAAAVAGAVVAIVTTPPPVLTMLWLVGSPSLVFLALEQQLAAASDQYKRRLSLELPVIAEQLGMLLSAGYSLTGSLDRIAQRGQGTSGRDLRRVLVRIRQGVPPVAALREWAAVADLDELHRLVSVLALNREAGDLGRLIAEEARSVRRGVHRQLIEQIERRSQLVWIPVTVSALVPGALFIAVPFLEALRTFGAT